MKQTNAKIMLLGMIGLFLMLVVVDAVMADEYCLLQMTKGQRIHVSDSYYYTCTHTICQICVDSKQGYAPNKCSKVGICEGGSGPGNEPNLTLSAIFPFADNGVFTKQTFFLEIYTNKIANIDLIDNVAGTQRNLCPNCAEYRKSANFKQGFNDITIRAVKGGEVLEKRIRFFIDNQKPRITKTLPAQKKFSSGDFIIYYDEDNIKSITLSYGSSDAPITKALTGCESGKKKNCTATVDLSSFDGQEISYWFTILDVADNLVASKPIKVLVDKTAPNVLSFNYTVDSKRKSVNFMISLTDANMDKILYYDNGATRAVNLCTTLSKDKNNPSILICNKKANFRTGHHVLDMEIKDKAGNLVSRTAEFDID